jgi:hypothetical protein
MGKPAVEKDKAGIKACMPCPVNHLQVRLSMVLNQELGRFDELIKALSTGKKLIPL